MLYNWLENVSFYATRIVEKLVIVVIGSKTYCLAIKKNHIFSHAHVHKNRYAYFQFCNVNKYSICKQVSNFSLIQDCCLANPQTGTR